RTKKGHYILSDTFPHTNFKYRLRDKETMEKFKAICMEKYGVENPGVLGAVASKAGEKYIRNFISENKIDESKCYFKNGGINKNEYFLNVYDKKLQKYVFYSY